MLAGPSRLKCGGPTFSCWFAPSLVFLCVSAINYVVTIPTPNMHDIDNASMQLSCGNAMDVGNCLRLSVLFRAKFTDKGKIVNDRKMLTR